MSAEVTAAVLVFEGVVEVVMLILLIGIFWKGRLIVTKVQEIKDLESQLAAAVTTIAQDVAALEAQIPAAGEILTDEDAAAIKAGLQDAVKKLTDAAASVSAPAADQADGAGDKQ